VRFRSRDGQWTVDVIQLGATSDHRDGQRFRIARGGYFIAEARSIEELAQHVDLADLDELQPWPTSSGCAPSAAMSLPAGPRTQDRD
jgi:hypothetical protein